MAAEVVSDRIVTVPNALSVARLLGVPLFAWLLLTEVDGWALLVLMVAGFTDWLDGVVARRTGQITRLGQLLDPIADRLYIAAALVCLLIRGIVPWWLVLVLVGRDAVLAVVMSRLRSRGTTGLPVHYVGKAATFNLLYAFPLLLLGAGTVLVPGVAADTARAFGWAMVLWGTYLYVYGGVLYVRQAGAIAKASERRAPDTAR